MDLLASRAPRGLWSARLELRSKLSSEYNLIQGRIYHLLQAQWRSFKALRWALGEPICHLGKSSSLCPWSRSRSISKVVLGPIIQLRALLETVSWYWSHHPWQYKRVRRRPRTWTPPNLSTAPENACCGTWIGSWPFQSSVTARGRTCYSKSNL